MGNLVFQATLGGQVNLVGPNTASTFNLNVPAVSSTLATLTGTETFTNKTLTTPTISQFSSASATNLTIQSAGTTAVTIDTSQNVGIGTSSITGRLHVDLPSGAGYYLNLSNAGTQRAWIYDYNTGLVSLGTQGAVNLGFNTNGSERMRIDSSGNVGIGTSSPNNKLDVVAGGDAARFGSTKKLYVSTDSGGFGLLSGAIQTGSGMYVSDISSYTTLWTNATERMRIDSSGNLLVGRTSGVATEKFSVLQSASDWVGQFVNSYSGTYYGIRVNSSSTQNNTNSLLYDGLDNGNLRFRVYSNGGIANYAANNSILSDQREKTNFSPATSYLDKICAIPVQTFNYIDQNLEEDGGLTLGVVAQDVQAIAPELVTEGNWGTKEEPKMRLEIYQTDLQYALMKSIQELKSIVDAQATRIATLEAK
jgi:Chaperone of endosialidase